MSARKHRKSGGKVGGEPVVPASGKTAKSKTQMATLQAERSNESKEAKGTKDAGWAKGGKAHHRPDRKHRASGGRTGASPFTSAHMLKTPGNSGAGQGHEDDGGKGSELSD